ncbi:MAG: hypothetical protein IJ658_09545 [Kiritimatiellae bacterium]|nr:hypothetical protein [Kiritimatiellia bacterium]
MKNLLLAAALVPLLAAAAADEPEESPAAKAAEKAGRVHAMTAAFRQSVVNVRFRLKTQPDGSCPSADMPYRCPACGNSGRHVHDSRFDEKAIPNLVAGFALGTNRVLVQDLAVRADWLDRLEVVCGTDAIPARPTLAYPDENAVLLETARPLPCARPLAFTGDATNAPSLFHVVEDADGRVKAGLRKINRDFTHYPATGEDWCAATPNTIVVDASNRAVSVQMRLDRTLGNVLPEPPARWRSEPFAEREARVAALEKRLLSSVLPVYLHIDEEKKPGQDRFFYSGSPYGDDAKLSGDVDTFGFALPDGDVLIPLNLTSGKVAALDRMEAALPDGGKVPLEFVGAFREHGMFLLRFADGRTPAGVSPLAFSSASPEELVRRTAYLAKPRNRNGKVQLSLAPRQIRGLKRSYGGAAVPDAAPEGSNGEVLLLESGDLAAMSGRVRSADEGWDGWRTRASIPGSTLARLVAERDFDPEFAVRKGKDRIRVAWIGVETQAMTKELAREKKSQGFLARDDAFVSGADVGMGSLVGKVYTNTPAARAGVREGDVLLWVRRATSDRYERLDTRDSRDFGMDVNYLFDRMPVSAFDRLGVTPWPQVEGGVNGVFTRLGIGTKVVLAWVSNGEKREAELILEQAPAHYRTARRIRNRTLGLVAADLTFEVRAYLKLADGAPGVVITKMQEGSPSAVAGLRPFEVITSVNGEPVPTAIRFSELIKGKTDLTFSVRRLDATRIVRIQLKSPPRQP